MGAVPARVTAPSPSADPRQVAAAEESFRAALRRDSRDASAQRNLAVLLAATGRLDEAIATFLAAAALAPADAAVWDGLAQALAAGGRFGEAAAASERAARLAPAADNLVRFVEYALRAARPERAVEVASELADRNPDDPAPALAHAELLHRLDRRSEAIAVARGCVKRWPALGPARAALGQALLTAGNAADAAAEFRQARRLQPRDAALCVAHGNALRALGERAGARSAYAAAIRLDASLAVAHFNLGLVRDESGDPDGALDSYDHAIAIDVDYAEARLNRAMVKLRAGRVTEAWDDYRWREPGVRAPVATRWPTDLAGRSILLRGEQGLGDQLFFLRFAALAVARGARVTVDGDPRLAALLARAGFPGGRHPGAEEAWLGDLPWLLQAGTTVTFPPPLPLVPDPARLDALRWRLEAVPRPWVAVTWRAGGRNLRRDTIKEVPLDAFGAALAGLPGTILSLQRNARPDELAALAAAAGRAPLDLGDCNDDLDDALAVMAIADAHVAVSNTNLHLRSGVGRPSRILVPHPFDWRFLAAGNGSLPWYPGQTAYRQAADGDWGPALRRLVADLGAEFAA